MASNLRVSSEEKNLLEQMISILESKGEYCLKKEINGINYDVQIVLPGKDEKVNIPYILAIPANINSNSRLAVESNNCDFDGNKIPDANTLLLKNALDTARQLSNVIQSNETPILIPILPPSIPSETSSFLYFQQLADECFRLNENNPFYRLDLQVEKVIEEAKERILSMTGVSIDDKIFLNGYSSSGVFAQRFALIHPELIDTLCVGGASGSIPFPEQEEEIEKHFSFNYPLGTRNYKELFGKTFDEEEYKRIRFRYYVGELEEERKTNERVDDLGNPAPMHDMSYFVASVPSDVGKCQRNVFGTSLIERATNQTKILNNLGYDISHTVIKGRGHSDVPELGITGVKEQGDRFISNTFNESANKSESLSNI